MVQCGWCATDVCSECGRRVAVDCERPRLMGSFIGQRVFSVAGHCQAMTDVHAMADTVPQA